MISWEDSKSNDWPLSFKAVQVKLGVVQVQSSVVQVQLIVRGLYITVQVLEGMMQVTV